MKREARNQEKLRIENGELRIKSIIESSPPPFIHRVLPYDPRKLYFVFLGVLRVFVVKENSMDQYLRRMMSFDGLRYDVLRQAQDDRGSQIMNCFAVFANLALENISLCFLVSFVSLW
jgi:hypothetical protein